MNVTKVSVRLNTQMQMQIKQLNTKSLAEAKKVKKTNDCSYLSRKGSSLRFSWALPQTRRHEPDPEESVRE